MNANQFPFMHICQISVVSVPHPGGFSFIISTTRCTQYHPNITNSLSLLTHNKAAVLILSIQLDDARLVYQFVRLRYLGFGVFGLLYLRSAKDERKPAKEHAIKRITE